MDWLRKLFAPRTTVRTEYRDLRPDEAKAFDEVFRHMDRAFAELDAVFSRRRK